MISKVYMAWQCPDGDIICQNCYEVNVLNGDYEGENEYTLNEDYPEEIKLDKPETCTQCREELTRE